MYFVQKPAETEVFLKVWKGYKKHLLYSLRENIKRAFYNWEVNKINDRLKSLSRQNFVLKKEIAADLEQISHMVLFGALNNFYAVDLMRISLLKLGIAKEIPELEGNLNLSLMLDILGIKRKQRIELWELLCKDKKNANYDSLKELFGEKDGKLNLEGLSEIDENNIYTAMPEDLPKEKQGTFWRLFSKEKKNTITIKESIKTNWSNLSNSLEWINRKIEPQQDVD